MGTIPLREVCPLSNTALARLALHFWRDNCQLCTAFGYGTALGQDFPQPIADAKSCRDDHLGAILRSSVGEHASPAGPQTTVMQTPLLGGCNC